MGLSDFFNKQFARFNFGGGTDRYTRDLATKLSQYYEAGQATYETITDSEAEIYSTTAALQIVISRKANMKACGIWRELDSNGDYVEDSEIVKFLKRPNPLQSGMEFVKQLEAYRCIWGAAFVNQVNLLQSNEFPNAIWSIIPSKMTIDITGNIYQQSEMQDIIKSYTFNKGGGSDSEQIYKPEEILYLRDFNANHPIFPESPFNGLNMEITNIRKAMGYRNVILDKKGAIGILSSGEKEMGSSLSLSPKEKKNIEKQFQSDYGLSDKDMKVIITSKPMTWQPMTYPTKDLLLFEEVEVNTKKIADRYGLDEKLFSSEKSNSLSESGSAKLEAVRMTYQDTIIPESEDDAQAFTEFFGLNEKGHSLVLDYSHIQALKDDEVKKSEVKKREAETVAIMIANGSSREDAEQAIGWVEM